MGFDEIFFYQKNVTQHIILIDNTIGIIAIFNEPKALSISLSRLVKLGKTSIYETWFG
mgnify:CR=1 FL=1